MSSSPGQSRNDAISIWQAAVDAVDSERLVENAIQCDADSLVINGTKLTLKPASRIAVVGAGKAGSGMVAGVKAVLQPVIERVHGFVNVPEDCVRESGAINLHGARPAGLNEPTQAGVDGAEEILRIVADLSPDDVCLVLISGGGSALLPAPAEGISLTDKQQVTRRLMQRGATINELNCVRKQISRVKGGGLAQACRAGHLVSLIISDVMHDPLDVIASGPTVENLETAADALQVLKRFCDRGEIPKSVWRFLESNRATSPPISSVSVVNQVIGNNAVALKAAAAEARSLGYHVHTLGANNGGEAADYGRELVRLAIKARDSGQPATPPVCILSGGEPTVRLSDTQQPRKGGRNQELVLAALDEAWDDGLERIAVLSGGTDGEDGPTDAAGGFVDAEVRAAAKSQRLEPAEFLSINNSYPFLEATGGLLITGPTHTNVMDIRVAVIR